MKEKEIAEWVISNVDPLSHPFYGKQYRCAAILNDGLYLPCIVISSSPKRIALALKRFDETKSDHAIVESFVASGNSLNHYDIKELKLSDYALSLDRLGEIKGETSMGWTEFYATMEDGKEFCLGTTFHADFFCMPEGYTADNVKHITPAVRGEPRKYDQVYRERPFFNCYIDGI